MIHIKKNLIQEVTKKINLINMWDIIHVINMKEFLQTLIKWFKCKLSCCFKSSCSVGEDNTEEKIYYDYYSGRRKSI